MLELRLHLTSILTPFAYAHNSGGKKPFLADDLHSWSLVSMVLVSLSKNRPLFFPLSKDGKQNYLFFFQSKII